MESVELDLFFLKLADKFRKENDLSDITWALCKAFPLFETLFLSYFFKEIKDDAGIDLKREVTRGCSRVDFFFATEKREYIIEVKKGDMDDHFEKYKKDFANAKFGWIANYKKETMRNDGIEIKTWEDFKSSLEECIVNNNMEPLTKNIIQSYCNYLKSVCSIIKYKKMKLDNLSSLYFFNRSIVDIIEMPFTGLDISVYTQSKGFKEDQSGTTFTIRNKDSTVKPIYSWFGIYYNEDKTCICMGFSENWCKSVFNGLKNKNQVEGNFFKKPYDEDREFWFELKEEIFAEFNAESDVNKQKDMLKKFFREVIESVKDYL
jgi:hypothetical protein